jgi:HSP20 family protein
MANVPSRKSEDRSLSQRGGDPLGHLRSQINRVFDDFWGESWLEPRREAGAPSGFWPQVDVTETDKEIKVCAEIPGVDPKDIEVSVEDGTLIIKGEKKYEREENEKGQYRMERSYGAFERSIALPAEVDESKAKADFKKGVLKLTLPKRRGAESRRKKIPVS